MQKKWVCVRERSRTRACVRVCVRVRARVCACVWSWYTPEANVVARTLAVTRTGRDHAQTLIFDGITSFPRQRGQDQRLPKNSSANSADAYPSLSATIALSPSNAGLLPFHRGSFWYLGGTTPSPGSPQPSTNPLNLIVYLHRGSFWYRRDYAFTGEPTTTQKTTKTFIECSALFPSDLLYVISTLLIPSCQLISIIWSLLPLIQLFSFFP